MKNLELTQMEDLSGGEDCETAIGGSAGMIIAGTFLFFTGFGSAAAIAIWGGALYGYYKTETLNC